MTTNKNLSKLLSIKPKTISLDGESVNVSSQDAKLPVVITPKIDHVILSEWIKNNSEIIRSNLNVTGGILFRGFSVQNAADFQNVINAVSSNMMEYNHRSSPRSKVAGLIYTSTDHPADQIINMHNELSYASSWPAKILFYCQEPALIGGETPIADVRKVYNLLSDKTKKSFHDKGVMYVRNLGNGLGLSWKEVFQTTEKKVVEAECAKLGMSYEWKDENHLVISWKTKAIQNHPVTNETIWFNHGFFFNRYALEAEIYNTLKNDLPFDTFYGDGSVIEESTIQEIRKAYEKSIITFQWKKGDVLVLDNMLVAHGRYAFEGNRRILVGMCDPISQ